MGVLLLGSLMLEYKLVDYTEAPPLPWEGVLFLGSLMLEYKLVNYTEAPPLPWEVTLGKFDVRINIKSLRNS